MNEEPAFDIDPVETSPTWTPSPALRGQLLLGAGAMLLSGCLSALSILVEMGRGPAQGFSLGHALGLASGIPLAFVWWVYRGVAREIGRYSVCKSSGCVFGSLFLLQLLDLTSEQVLSDGFAVAVLILVGVGVVGLIVFAFSASKTHSAVSGNSNEPSRGAARAGWGGLGIVLFILAKVGLKLVLAAGIKGGGYELMVFIVLIVSAMGFFLWFAVCKILARGQLGGLAAMVGVAELLGFVAACVLAARIVVSFVQVADQPGFDDKAAEEWGASWMSVVNWSAFGASLAWPALHALLLTAWWNRRDADADWLRDRNEMENEYRYH